MLGGSVFAILGTWSTGVDAHKLVVATFDNRNTAALHAMNVSYRGMPLQMHTPLSPAALGVISNIAWATRRNYAVRHFYVPDDCWKLATVPRQRSRVVTARCKTDGPFAPFFNTSDVRSGQWARILALKPLMREFEFVLMIDVDVIPLERALFDIDDLVSLLKSTGRSLALGTWIPKLAGRSQGIGHNDGILLLRSTPLMMQMVDDWWTLAAPGSALSAFSTNLYRDQTVLDIGILTQEKYAKQLIETDLLDAASFAGDIHPVTASPQDRREFDAVGKQLLRRLQGGKTCFGRSIGCLKLQLQPAGISPTQLYGARLRKYFGRPPVFAHMSTGHVKSRARQNMERATSASGGVGTAGATAVTTPAMTGDAIAKSVRYAPGVRSAAKTEMMLESIVESFIGVHSRYVQFYNYTRSGD